MFQWEQYHKKYRLCWTAARMNWLESFWNTDLASWASGRLTGAHMSVKAPQDATHTFPQRHPELTVQGDEMTP